MCDQLPAARLSQHTNTHTHTLITLRKRGLVTIPTGHFSVAVETVLPCTLLLLGLKNHLSVYLNKFACLARNIPKEPTVHRGQHFLDSKEGSVPACTDFSSLGIEASFPKKIAVLVIAMKVVFNSDYQLSPSTHLGDCA